MCTFYLGIHLCGVEVRDAHEVVEFVDITPVPLAPPEIRGLVNLRGQIVTVIDLRTLLDIDSAGALCPRLFGVIVRGGDDHLGLLVDGIGEVITADESSFEAPPETLTGHVRDRIRGVYKLEGKLLLMLDVKTITKQASY